MQRARLVIFLLLLAAIVASAQQAAPANDVPPNSDQWAVKKITPPELISREKAEFPVESKFQLMDGLCLVSMVVSIDGDPQNIRIIHCTDSSFEDGSMEAVKQYRFKPATTQEGKPVAVTVSAGIQYHWAKYFLSLHMLINGPGIPDKSLIFDRHMSKAEANREVNKPIHYGFIPLEGGASMPDSDGVYPLTRNITGPRVIKFSDEGYGRMAFVHEGNSPCDVVLTISTKGKASDPQVSHCERPELERPAVASLLKSNYKPGMVRGKEVPMRASMHLDYGNIQGALLMSPE